MANNQVNSDDIKNKLGLENTETHRKKWVVYVIIMLLLSATVAYFVVANKKSKKSEIRNTRVANAGFSCYGISNR